MKKLLTYIASVAFGTVLVVSFCLTIQAHANVNGLDIRSTNTQNPSNANSTTTRNFMTAGTGTTTFAFYTERTDEISLFTQFEGSTTAAVLDWQYEWSNDNVNWFEEDLTPTYTLNTNGVDHASTTITHKWNPGTTATSSKVVRVPNIPAKYTRVKFFIPVGGASGTMWAQAALKSINNQ